MFPNTDILRAKPSGSPPLPECALITQWGALPFIQGTIIMGFTKLDEGIVLSSIWSEPPETRVVWVTMLAMADHSGFISASLPGLVRAANIPTDAVVAALKKFQEPDEYSRTPDNEGRRIEAVSGGWIILNHGKYRSHSYSNTPDAVRMRLKRANKNEQNEHVRTSSNVSASASVLRSSFKALKDQKKDPVKRSISIETGFEEFWVSYPKRVGKGAAQAAWKKILQQAETLEKIKTALKWQIKSEQWSKENGQFIPNPATYLNQKRWMDEPIKPYERLPVSTGVVFPGYK